MKSYVKQMKEFLDESHGYTWDEEQGKYVRIDDSSETDESTIAVDEMVYTWDEEQGEYIRIDGMSAGLTKESVDEAESVPLTRHGQGSYKKDTHPSDVERLYQAKDKTEYERLMRAGTNAMNKKMLAPFGLVGDYKKYTVNIKFKDEKSRKKFEKSFGIKESVELNEKVDLKGLSDDAKGLLASAINFGASDGGPYAEISNLDYFTPEVFADAMKFIKMNKSQMAKSAMKPYKELLNFFK
jgi:hypothetical protein